MIKLEQVRSSLMNEQSGLLRHCLALGKMLEMTKAVTGFQRTECNFERSSTIKPLVMLEKLFLKGVHWCSRFHCPKKLPLLPQLSATTTLISQQLSTLRQSPPPTKKIKACALFFKTQCYCPLNRLQCSATITFICTWKPEKFIWLALLQYSLYCCGLELN